jgi:uncharacterized membrane-anchored protein
MDLLINSTPPGVILIVICVSSSIAHWVLKDRPGSRRWRVAAAACALMSAAAVVVLTIARFALLHGPTTT